MKSRSSVDIRLSELNEINADARAALVRLEKEWRRLKATVEPLRSEVSEKRISLRQVEQRLEIAEDRMDAINDEMQAWARRVSTSSADIAAINRRNAPK